MLPNPVVSAVSEDRRSVLQLPSFPPKSLPTFPSSQLGSKLSGFRMAWIQFSSKSSAFATTSPAWLANIRIFSAATSACILAVRFSFMSAPTSKLSLAFSSVNLFESSSQNCLTTIFRIRSGRSDGVQSASWHASLSNSPLMRCSTCISPNTLQM
jgi:hypothetical protein